MGHVQPILTPRYATLCEMEGPRQHPFARDACVIIHPGVEGPPLTDEMVTRAESVLGLSLPSGYLALMRCWNGGYLMDTVVPTSRPTSWASDRLNLVDLRRTGRGRRWKPRHRQ